MIPEDYNQKNSDPFIVPTCPIYMKILKTTPDQIKEFRTDYLNSLSEFQELFLEMMIHNADFYKLQSANATVGYFIINKECVLIEFYIINKFIPIANDIFEWVLNDLAIKEVYCKSFDALLLGTCLLNNMTDSVHGLLYRDYVEPLIQKDREIIMKRSDLQSVEMFMQQDNSIKELFENESQLMDFIRNESVFEFYRNEMFVGCGMVIRTVAGWNYCDLGVWVHPSQRGQSLGSQIILYLREYAVNKNLKPSCGCAINNIASQKTIEKSGFVSKYKMIRFGLEKLSSPRSGSLI